MYYCGYCNGWHSSNYCPMRANNQLIEAVQNQRPYLETIGHIDISSELEKHGNLLSSRFDDVIRSNDQINNSLSEGLDDLRYALCNNHDELMDVMEGVLEELRLNNKLRIKSFTVDYIQRLNEAQKNFSDKRFDKCLMALDKAEQLKSDDHRIYLLRGHTYERLGKLDKALESYKEAIMISVSNDENVNVSYKAYCLYLISGIYFSMKNIEMAIKKIKECLQLADEPAYNYQYASFLAYQQQKLLKR